MHAFEVSTTVLIVVNAAGIVRPYAIGWSSIVCLVRKVYCDRTVRRRGGPVDYINSAGWASIPKLLAVC